MAIILAVQGTWLLSGALADGPRAFLTADYPRGPKTRVLWIRWSMAAGGGAICVFSIALAGIGLICSLNAVRQKS